jgi:peptidoglycan/xylan/chitin deacetylase (PgdA/CDA1 family)
MHLHWLLPTIKGIPVLMYHRVWPGHNDELTIDPPKLKEQWSWMKKGGYHTLSLSEFLIAAKTGKYPKKSFLITFDDGYTNNLEYVYPILKEFNWTATFFIIADNIDGTAKQSKNTANKKMDLVELKQLDPSIVQLGMHGYNHESFADHSIEDIKTILTRSVAAFDNSGLTYYKALAYPYGARPKNTAAFTELKKWMRDNGIEAAFRIGNQVSKIPAPDMYEIRRIDIKGTDTMEDFKIKLKKGKLKPF